MKTNSNTLVSGPTFLLIGAQKCGTTWLCNMIRQHPEVSRISKKEIHFFNKSVNYNKGKEWYIKQFSLTPCTKAIGEYTPNYFWTYAYNELIGDTDILQDIPKLIYNFNPNIKLILILRNPVRRAISAYYHHIKNGNISPKEEILDVINNYGIISMGFYDIHLKNWLNFFPIESFLILIYEIDLLDENKLVTIKRVFKHIGIDEDFTPFKIKKIFYPQGSYFEIQAKYFFSKYVTLKYFFSKYVTLLSFVMPNYIKNHKYWNLNFSDYAKKYLEEIYKYHNIELSNLLGRKLPWY